MKTGRRSNVVAFPLSRSEQRTPGREVFRVVEGKIIVAPAASAGVIPLREALGRTHQASPKRLTKSR